MKRFVPVFIAASLLSAVPCFADTSDNTVVSEDAVLESYASGTYCEEWNVWFDKSSGRITGYDGNAENLVLPSEIDGTAVVGIDDRAFSGAGFKSVVLPSTLTAIGYRAFLNCTSLEEITIPKNVTSSRINTAWTYYGTWFEGCSELKKVIFEDGATLIPREALENSTVTEVVIPDSVDTIGTKAFANVKTLKEIKLPASLVSINEEAFIGCSSLESIVIPKYVTSIWDRAFSGCTSLKNVELGSGLTAIGYRVFLNCSSLTEITIPKSVTSSRLNTAWTYYGTWFEGCSELKKVIFEDGATLIPREALENSTVTEVVIPDSVDTIGTKAFANVKTLKEIKLPASLVSINEEAFIGCSSLEEIIIPDSTENIWDRAFSGCSGIKNIKLGTGVKSIGYRAFLNCSSITEMSIPKSVTSSRLNTAWTYYGNWFSGCTSLGKVVFESGTTAIPREALANAYINEVEMPLSLRRIGVKAFENCINLKTVKIPGRVNEVGDGAFSGCSKLEKAMFKGNAPEVTDINSYYGIQLFKNCYTDFEINYLNGKSGWTEPEWKTYPSKGVDTYGDTDEKLFEYGDADADGVLSAGDSAAILQKVLKSTHTMKIEKESGADYMVYVDVDGDEELTAADSAAVLQKVLNNSFKMPVEK